MFTIDQLEKMKEDKMKFICNTRLPKEGSRSFLDPKCENPATRVIVRDGCPGDDYDSGSTLYYCDGCLLRVYTLTEKFKENKERLRILELTGEIAHKRKQHSHELEAQRYERFKEEDKKRFDK